MPNNAYVPPGKIYAFTDKRGYRVYIGDTCILTRCSEEAYAHGEVGIKNEVLVVGDHEVDNHYNRIELLDSRPGKGFMEWRKKHLQTKKGWNLQ